MRSFSSWSKARLLFYDCLSDIQTAEDQQQGPIGNLSYILHSEENQKGLLYARLITLRFWPTVLFKNWDIRWKSSETLDSVGEAHVRLKKKVQRIKLQR